MKKHDLFILPDALLFAIVGIAVSFIVYYSLGLTASLLPIILTLFVLLFFRNPPRKAIAGPGDVLSPADGRVVSIDEVEETEYINGPAIKISIFLSLADVHVNRSPIAGKVEYLKYKPGKFFPAFKGHASHLNERNYLGIRNEENPGQYLLVVQITGFIARRIACWSKKGDVLTLGQRFGVIKFGSRTDVYLPKGCEVLTKKGHRVKGGVTVIGRLCNE